jgi:ribosomal protein L22
MSEERKRVEEASAEGAEVDPKEGAEEAKEAVQGPDDSPQSLEAETEETPEAEAEEEPAAEKKPARRRRGSAETSAAAKKAPAPRAPDGTVRVRAQARYVRTAPRKARLVIQHIRGKQIDDARAILRHTPRAASRDILKLLESAVANAENNHELVADDLVVAHAYVDEGPTLKRYRPRALGRATRIRKRTSHMTIELAPKE